MILDNENDKAVRDFDLTDETLRQMKDENTVEDYIELDISGAVSACRNNLKEIIAVLPRIQKTFC